MLLDVDGSFGVFFWVFFGVLWVFFGVFWVTGLLKFFQFCLALHVLFFFGEFLEKLGPT